MLPWTRRCLANPIRGIKTSVLILSRFQSTIPEAGEVNLTDLEKRDEIYKRQRKLASAHVKLKSYANGHLQPGSTNFKKPVHDLLYKGGPVRELTVSKRKTAGRNNTGHITIRGRGGGHKQRYRFVDSHRLEGGKQTVLRIEYDPNRSGHIALVKHDETGDLSYILAASGLREGDVVESCIKGFTKDLHEENKQTNKGVIY